MRISDWSSDVCSSDLGSGAGGATREAPSRVSAPEQAELVEQPGHVDYASGTKGRVPLVFPPGGSCHHRHVGVQRRTFSGLRMGRARTEKIALNYSDTTNRPAVAAMTAIEGAAYVHSNRF